MQKFQPKDMEGEKYPIGPDQTRSDGRKRKRLQNKDLRPERLPRQKVQKQEPECYSIALH